MKRNTKQDLLPVKKVNTRNGNYDIFPFHALGDGLIHAGYQLLAGQLSKQELVVLEGYVGVDWKDVVQQLNEEFEKMGVSVTFHNANQFFKKTDEIEAMVEPFLGGEDLIFGYRTTLSLEDYLDYSEVAKLRLHSNVEMNIIFGTGSSLLGIDGYLVYFDLPKNELQFRTRAGEVYNLGIDYCKPPKAAYKHFYFVDWIVLNKHKKKLLSNITLFVDQQRPGIPAFASGKAVRKGLNEMSQSFFRVRPWFEPGVWGGQWIKEKIPDLNQDVTNYDWTFEMIVHENGLLFESDGNLLEVSFDVLMFQEKENVLGKAANRFQDEFPIRFDFLDTFDGGNLSVQCHPKPEFIQKEFGESFTQDETYYILDAKRDALVYLGFQKDIVAGDFRKALEESHKNNSEIDVA